MRANILTTSNPTFIPTLVAKRSVPSEPKIETNTDMANCKSMFLKTLDKSKLEKDLTEAFDLVFSDNVWSDGEAYQLAFQNYMAILTVISHIEQAELNLDPAPNLEPKDQTIKDDLDRKAVEVVNALFPITDYAL